MKTRISVVSATLLAALSSVALAPREARADLTVLVTANTSSIAGQSGVLDMQFNGSFGLGPNSSGITYESPSGTAAVSNFQFDSTTTFNTNYASYPSLWSPPQLGSVSGTPLTGMTMTSDYVASPGPNEFDLLGTFGQSLSFEVTFSGNMMGPVQGPDSHGNVFNEDNGFAFDFLDATTGSSLETGASVDTNGIVVAAGGALSFTDGSNGGDLGVSISIVPEPMTLTLMALGGLALLRRRKVC